jgi:CelD/BcsL family acetyltransferase involved in cellulose biosynthesis
MEPHVVTQAVVSSVALERRTDAAAEWQALEARVDCSFFQSWGWVGTWLEALPESVRPEMLRITLGGETRGFGLLMHAARRRHGLIRSRTLFVQETGVPALDCLTVEHGGLLAGSADLGAVIEGVLRHLERRGGWDELFVAGVDLPLTATYLRVAAARGMMTCEEDRKPSFVVDLARVRQGSANYLAALSSNTRYQIRRSMREFERRGPLRIESATSTAEALQSFAALGELHQRYWQSRGQPGAFANDFFVRFHRLLIERRFEHGNVQLLRVRAGDDDVGWLYNFVHRGRVYSYQSGFAYGNGAKLKPGLVSHVLAIQHNLELGHTAYDLLAGDSQYKRSLSNDHSEMVWLCLQRPRLRFRLEALARALRDRMWPQGAAALGEGSGTP